MAYTVRKGKLHFEPRTGNGPCSRRRAHQPDRRILREFVRNGVEHRYHATKGWRYVRAAGRAT